jgi:HprK-related kinase A
MRGWRLLSDELALISTTDGQLNPIPRPISLKNESIAVIKGFAPDATIGPEFVETKKGTVAHMKAPTESVERAEELAVPTWLINPKYQTGVTATLDPRPKGRTLINVLKNAFNYNLLGLTGFETVARLIDGSEPYDLVYGELNEAVALLDKLVLSPGQVLTRARA